jgi:thymidylate synthase (FAD)
MVQRGVPAEDARFVLPNATNTNFKVTVNFLEFLHIADLRLCTRAQWEFRKVVAMMRAEIMRKFPELAIYVQPKCGEYRLGYCDEAYADWERCPIGRKRPHKTDLFAIYDAHRRGEFTPVEVAKATDAPLDAADYQIIESEEGST